MEKIKNLINKNKIELIIAFASTLAHDSINEFIYLDKWKFQIGRVLAPVFKSILGNKIAMMWSTGFVSLIFLSLATFFIIKIFKIKSKLITVLISGILTVNISIIALTASCIGDLDVDVLSILFAILGVYCWKNYKYGFIYGSILGTFVLGIYQCNISVMITLIIMCSIVDLIQKKDFKEVFINGLKGIFMILLAGILYILLLKILPICVNIELLKNTYNSTVIREISIKNIYNSYVNCIKSIIEVPLIYPANLTKFINLVLFVIMLTIYANIIRNKKYELKAKFLITILFIIIPFGMNISYILDGGYAHDIMKYAYWLIYIFILILAYNKISLEGIKDNMQNLMKNCSYILIFCIIWGNVGIANEVYLKKEIEGKATYAYMNRVLERIENFEGYEAGITEVCFVGNEPESLNENIIGFKNSYIISGNSSSFAINCRGDRIYYQAYFNYVMLNPIKLTEQKKWDKMKTLQEIKEMKSYPSSECMKIVDNVLVVKI